MWSGPLTHFHTCLCPWEIIKNTETRCRTRIAADGNIETRCLLARSHRPQEPVLGRSFQRIWGQSLRWHSSQQLRPRQKKHQNHQKGPSQGQKKLMVVAVFWVHNMIPCYSWGWKSHLSIETLKSKIKFFKPVKKPNLNEYCQSPTSQVHHL